VFKRISAQKLGDLLYETFPAGHQETIFHYGSSMHGAHGTVVIPVEAREPSYAASFLVVDVRDEASYDSLHIREARHFPVAAIKHDRFTAEIHAFKSGVGRCVIVVDDDERLAAAAAQALVEKGYQAVFLLSGGLREFARAHPALLDPPRAPFPAPAAAPTAHAASAALRGGAARPHPLPPPPQPPSHLMMSGGRVDSPPSAAIPPLAMASVRGAQHAAASPNAERYYAPRGGARSSVHPPMAPAAAAPLRHPTSWGSPDPYHRQTRNLR
jgi:rhodanese-related sulfurtransferase